MQQREIGMQEITFAKGNEQHLKDCRAALCQSTLGERYFSSPGSAEIAILEGIRQENLYVAFIGEECVMRWLYIYHSQRRVSQFPILAYHRREGRIQKQGDRQGSVELFRKYRV